MRNGSGGGSDSGGSGKSDSGNGCNGFSGYFEC